MKAAYNRLNDEAKAERDKYMAKYYAGSYYKKLVDKYMPQVNKMDKSHLAMAICNGANLSGMDHFAWKKLKELGPDIYQLQFIKEHGGSYNADIYEEACDMLQEMQSNFTA